MEECTPVYYIAIPTHVLGDLRISPTSKLLYGVIDSFLRRTGVCYASNDRLAKEVANCSERTISRCVGELKEAGYIDIVTEKKAAGKQPCRKIFLTLSADDGQGVDKIGYPPRQNCLGGHDKNGDIVNKKSKREKKTIDPLPVFVEWISSAFPESPREEKNCLYQHLVDYTDMRRDSKSPLNTERKVSGLLEDLIEQSSGSIPVMCEMLKTAKRRCWLSVHAPNDAPKQSPSGEGTVMVI